MICHFSFLESDSLIYLKGPVGKKLFVRLMFCGKKKKDSLKASEKLFIYTGPLSIQAKFLQFRFCCTTVNFQYLSTPLPQYTSAAVSHVSSSLIVSRVQCASTVCIKLFEITSENVVTHNRKLLTVKANMTTATLTNDSSILPSIFILPQNKLAVVFNCVVIMKSGEVMISELNPRSEIYRYLTRSLMTTVKSVSSIHA